MSQLPNTNISGGIPFYSGGNIMSSDLAGSYNQSYNAALEQNKAQYANILQGYQQTAQGQQQNQQGIMNQYGTLNQGVTGSLAGGLAGALGTYQQGAQQTLGGYGQLGQNVQGTIAGIGQSQSQAIADAYAQQTGQLGQSMVSRGLGNTTVQGAMQRGLSLDQQKAQIALSNQMAQLQAGYQSQLGLAGLGFQGQVGQTQLSQQNLSAELPAQYGSQLGLAGLGYQNQANQQYTGQANNQLGFMNSVQMNYPNAQTYAQLLYNQGQEKALAGSQGMAQQYLDLARARMNQPQIGSGAPPIQGRTGGMQWQPSPYSSGIPGGFQPMGAGQGMSPATSGYGGGTTYDLGSGDYQNALQNFPGFVGGGQEYGGGMQDFNPQIGGSTMNLEAAFGGGLGMAGAY